MKKFVKNKFQNESTNRYMQTLTSRSTYVHLRIRFVHSKAFFPIPSRGCKKVWIAKCRQTKGLEHKNSRVKGG